MPLDANKTLIRRYYGEMWNRWNYLLADELIDHQIRFRGSLGVAVVGREAFTEYMRTVQRAFPDFHNKIEELIAEGDKVVARLTYSGTHRGERFGNPPTGHGISYCGVAIFRVSNKVIMEGWVLGDTQALQDQLKE
jgi:predicted ester cyclase